MKCTVGGRIHLATEIYLHDDFGQTIAFSVDAATAEALDPDRHYTIAFVPFVKATDPAAVLEAAEKAPCGDYMVPVDHPLVISPEDAHNAEPANYT